MSVNLAAIKNQLLPGLIDVTGEYDQVAQEWQGIFTTKKSNMTQERSLQVRYLGPSKIKTEGGATAIDNDSGDRWAYNMEPIESGLMYTITRKAIDDGLYKDAFRPANLGLQQSMRAFWNVMAANVFNTAGIFDPNTGGDGQPFLSTAHPVDTGTFANTNAVPLSLNEASLIAGAVSIQKNFVDEAGILQDIFAEDLVIPLNLEATAIRLLKTDLRPGTAANDVNVIPTVGGGIKNFRKLKYLTSDFSWFLTTTVKGLIHLDRVPFETDMMVDFDTDNLKVKSYQRGGFFFTDPRSLWGQLASS